MRKYPVFEALAVYCVLFLPEFNAGFGGQEEAEFFPFSTLDELYKTLTYDVPVIALIALLSLRDLLFLRTTFLSALPRKREAAPLALSCAVVFVLLCGTGFLVTLAQTAFESVAEMPAAPWFEGPSTAAGFLVMSLSSLATGCLEEGFFRYYLLRRFKEAGVGVFAAAAVSVILFTAGHLYEGLWGLLNAFLAGSVLCAAYIYLAQKRRTAFALYTVITAHAAWNILVFTLQ